MTKKYMVEKSINIIEKSKNALQLLGEQITPAVADVVGLIYNCPGHVLVAGAGTSRAVAVRFAHLLACCGTPALPINAADALHGGAGSIKKGDVIYIISKGGESREINRFAEIAKSRGAKIISQTEKPQSTLGKKSDAIFHIVAPSDVDPYGMIATGSSLVNSAAGNILCELLLEKRGYTKEQFGATHPEGAVGKTLEQERVAENGEQN